MSKQNLLDADFITMEFQNLNENPMKIKWTTIPTPTPANTAIFTMSNSSKIGSWSSQPPIIGSDNDVLRNESSFKFRSAPRDSTCTLKFVRFVFKFEEGLNGQQDQEDKNLKYITKEKKKKSIVPPGSWLNISFHLPSTDQSIDFQ